MISSSGSALQASMWQRYDGMHIACRQSASGLRAVAQIVKRESEATEERRNDAS
jgi:hypothetical protein